MRAISETVKRKDLTWSEVKDMRVYWVEAPHIYPFTVGNVWASSSRFIDGFKTTRRYTLMSSCGVNLTEMFGCGDVGNNFHNG